MVGASKRVIPPAFHSSGTNATEDKLYPSVVDGGAAPLPPAVLSLEAVPCYASLLLRSMYANVRTPSDNIFLTPFFFGNEKRKWWLEWKLLA